VAAIRPEATPQKKGGFNKWGLRLGGTLIFVLILIYAVSTGKLDFSKIGDHLLHANWWLAGLSILLVFPFILMKSSRWRAILQSYGISLTPWQAWRIYAIGLGAGQFTPGQAGDVLKAWYLKGLGYPLSAALLSTLIDRLYDIAFLGIIALEGVLVFSQQFGSQLPIVLLLLAGATAAVVALSLRPVRERLIGLVMQRLSKGDSDPAAGGPGGDHKPDISSVLAGGQRALFTASLFTAFSFVISISRVWLCAAALGINLDVWQVIGVNSLTTVAALIPLSVGGLGTRDAVLVILLGLLGYATAEASVLAIALSTLILLLNITNVVVGYVVWLRSPDRIDSAEAAASA